MLCYSDNQIRRDGKRHLGVAYLEIQLLEMLERSYYLLVISTINN